MMKAILVALAALPLLSVARAEDGKMSSDDKMQQSDTTKSDDKMQHGDKMGGPDEMETDAMDHDGQKAKKKSAGAMTKEGSMKNDGAEYGSY